MTDRLTERGDEVEAAKIDDDPIREILRRLYAAGVKAGIAADDIGGCGDGYDHSTAYDELRAALDAAEKRRRTT